MGPLDRFWAHRYDWAMMSIILVTVAALAVFTESEIDKARHDRAVLDVKLLRSDVERWRAQHGRLPRDFTEMDPTGVAPRDPLGVPYVYVRSGESFAVFSVDPSWAPIAAPQ